MIKREVDGITIEEYECKYPEWFVLIKGKDYKHFRKHSMHHNEFWAVNEARFTFNENPANRDANGNKMFECKVVKRDARKNEWI